MIQRISLLATILASLTFSPAATNKHLDPPNVPDNLASIVPDDLASNSSYYSFRRDVRRCAAPRCGGYFVKLVNHSRTRCADNRSQSECYVATIDWRGQPELDNNRGLLRGTIRRKGKFGELRVSEVWRAGTANQPTGTFYRVRDRSPAIRCIAAPCPTHFEAKLNSTAVQNMAGVDFSGLGAPENLVTEAINLMISEGILISGTRTFVTGKAGRLQALKATQFYLRAGGGSVSQKPCMKTGCSRQVCSDEEVITTCEFKPEYECYKQAACERQKSGECGFTQTPELAACLRRAR